MFEWLNNNIELALVILSVFGLVGGSFSAEGLTFKFKTAKGKVNIFLMVIGSVGLLLIVANFIIN
ncbi:MAG: hypothetical protein NTW69_11350 [Chloroflexi bacterium]|jgi:hypothetical protein|nr:hypothetical protein [Chloroflexota bacterium]